ncbi:sensor histidine kinase [Pedobacter ginsengisoli]|uniref:sensor histidine kinase n=1 Tax=Pedobacter ginsengisoli TaxID=363852 RepID=UPI002550CB71|nr:7TM diverse intracellular signaling domain-containing protein [Pedobacter ginsengisoli]
MTRGAYKVLFSTLILLLSSSIHFSYARQIILKNREKSYTLHYPAFLADTKGEIKLQQLSTAKFEASAYPTLSLGATTASVWIKTSIINRSKTTGWHIQIDSPPVLQTVEVYQKKAGSLVKIFSSDASKAKTTGDVRVNNLLIPISIPINTGTEYYIHARSNNILRLPIKITTLQKAFERGYLTDLINGIVFGMLMAFAIYNLFVYLLIRELPYLYYLGAIFFWSLNLFFYNGFLPDILSSLIWLNSAGTIIGFASLLSIFFTNSFLQTRQNSPVFNKLRGLMSALSIGIIIIDVFWKGAYSFMLIQYLMYPYFMYWFGAGIISFRKGYKPAIFFLVGFGCLMLGNAVYNLKDLNILPDNLFTQTSMHWGTLLEALVLSFALASRLNFYRKEKGQIQLKTIEEKRTFLKELLQRQELEKKRVAMELHDNIGQQLIVIKNRSWRLQQLVEEPLKKQVSIVIDHIAAIMAEVREILHRLRPYQMDLMGLTQSIRGLISDTFADYDVRQGNIDEINECFNPAESIHIFRILQLLSAGILLSAPANEIGYTVTKFASSVDFQFDIQAAQQPFNMLPDINNRLELLKGTISIKNIGESTQITINIPFYS